MKLWRLGRGSDLTGWGVQGEPRGMSFGIREQSRGSTGGGAWVRGEGRSIGGVKTELTIQIGDIKGNLTAVKWFVGISVMMFGALITANLRE